MKKGIFLILLCIIVVLSCDKEPKITGSLKIKVLLNDSEPIPDAEITTNPKSDREYTDETGTVLIEEIEIGIHEVFARTADIGYGKIVVDIMPNSLTDTVINIQGSAFGLTLRGPTATITSPTEPAEFSAGEEITFTAYVEDDETPNEDLEITWESYIDGVLHTDSPHISGISSFTTSSLSKGDHQIWIAVEDKQGFLTRSYIQVNTLFPSSITLLDPVKEAGKVKLEWTEYANADFVKYEIYRTDGDCSAWNPTLVTTISDRGTTNFIDKTPPLTPEACYFIKAINNEDLARNSNSVIVDSPSGDLFDIEPTDMLKHPSDNFVYLVDQDAQRLLKYDILKLEVVREINLQGEVGYCDIGDNGFGVELYAPSEDGNIYVYDPDDLSLITTINTGVPNASVVINGLGHVIVSVEPSPWQDPPVHTYSRSSGNYIDGNGDHRRDRLRMIPGKNEIISLTTGLSPVDMEYFKLSDDGLIEIHADDQYHGTYYLDPNKFRISPDGTYSITSEKGTCYTTNSSMDYIGQFIPDPFSSDRFRFSDFAFNDDGSIIYASTSNKKSIQIGEYSSLTIIDEILTKGYPLSILRFDNKIVSLSRSTERKEQFRKIGIEIIDL